MIGNWERTRNGNRCRIVTPVGILSIHLSDEGLLKLACSEVLGPSSESPILPVSGGVAEHLFHVESYSGRYDDATFDRLFAHAMGVLSTKLYESLNHPPLTPPGTNAEGAP